MVQMFNDGELNHSVATCLTWQDHNCMLLNHLKSFTLETESLMKYQVGYSLKVDVKGAIKNILQINKTDYIFTFSGHSSVNKFCFSNCESASQPFLKNTCFFISFP